MGTNSDSLILNAPQKETHGPQSGDSKHQIHHMCRPFLLSFSSSPPLFFFFFPAKGNAHARPNRATSTSDPVLRRASGVEPGVVSKKPHRIGPRRRKSGRLLLLLGDIGEHRGAELTARRVWQENEELGGIGLDQVVVAFKKAFSATCCIF